MAAEERVILPAGFQLTQVATDELATNIFCMLTLPDGGALVSGPGYIKKLVDTDKDGVFDIATIVSDFPKSGAQGMAVDGDDLLCVGDGGIWRLPQALDSSDTDGAKKPAPVRLFAISTSGEHHAHSIQRGPDGWWYHIAGNHAKFDEAKCDGPIRNRRAGIVMRFSPDFSKRQIMVHGFRNAYDFAFNSTGQLFTYDSDGERDLGLPWYRPARVFEIVPGDDAGWVSKTWKRPSYYFDMPRLVGATGRASPTGVVCYDGTQFPVEYDDAIFLGDWTFGRVLVCKREWKTGKYHPPTDFLHATGSFGFAVTDLAVTANGSLLVSVGGRGTEGGVWRVNSTKKRKESEESLGKHVREHRQAFRQNPAIDAAIERASKAFQQKESAVQVDALASLLICSQSLEVDRYGSDVLEVLVKASQSNDAKVISATLRCVDALYNHDSKWESLLISESKPKDVNARLLMLAKVASQLAEPERLDLFDVLLSPMTFDRNGDRERSFPDSVACRLAQLLVGGVGDADDFFASMVANNRIKRSEIQTRTIKGLIFRAIEQATDGSTRMELARLLAMENVPASLAGGFCLDQIDSDQSDELDRDFKIELGLGREDADDLAWLDRPGASADLHWLMCLVQLEPTEDDKFIDRLANILLNIEKKFQKQNVKTDSHFRPMLDELASRAMDKYPGLEKRFLGHEDFGAAHHGYLFSEFSDDDLTSLQGKLVAQLEKRPRLATVDHVLMLAKSPTLETVAVLRTLVKKQSLRDTITLALARCGDANDETVFVDGLKSFNPRVQKESAIALRRLIPDVSAQSAAVAWQAAMRLGHEQQDVSIRDQLVLVLRKFAGKEFGYQLKKPELRQGDTLLLWRAFLSEAHPELAEALMPAESGQKQLARLLKLDWESGDAQRGKLVFEKLQCVACHGTSRALGPRLGGVSRRMGKTDLLTAIVNPDAQVSDRYRTSLYETIEGQLFSGSVIYENVDGVTIRESSGKTVRLNRDQIETQRRSAKSIMPTGLLDQTSDQEVADLMAFLKTL